MTATAIALLLTIPSLILACRKAETPATETTAAAPPPATEPAPATPEVASATPAIDACAVLPRETVVKLFGPLKEGPANDTGLSKEKLCKYTNEDGSWLQVSLYGTDRWELQKNLLPNPPTPIASLGDEAFSIKRGTDSVVFVRKGGGVLEISCSCDRSKAEALAAAGVSSM
jgi:hypothetical protein